VSGKRERGHCPACDGDYWLTFDGRIRKHRPAGGNGVPCPGSGAYSREELSEAGVANYRARAAAAGVPAGGPPQ
jgi:hypothetical protein